MPRGGRRPGAGRKKQEGHNIRPQHGIRAFDDEWELIKAFAKIVKKNKELAVSMMEELSSERMA